MTRSPVLLQRLIREVIHQEEQRGPQNEIEDDGPDAGPRSECVMDRRAIPRLEELPGHGPVLEGLDRKRQGR